MKMGEDECPGWPGCRTDAHPDSGQGASEGKQLTVYEEVCVDGGEELMLHEVLSLHTVWQELGSIKQIVSLHQTLASAQLTGFYQEHGSNHQRKHWLYLPEPLLACERYPTSCNSPRACPLGRR